MISTNLTSRFLLPSSASSILLLILCSVLFFSENKFYLSKGLNILQSIKTEEGGEKKHTKTSLVHLASGSCC